MSGNRKRSIGSSSNTKSKKKRVKKGEEEQWDVNFYLKWWEAKKKKIAAKKALLQLAKDEREFSRFRSKAVDVKEEDEASDVDLDGLSYEDAHLAFDIEKSPKLD